MEILPLLLGLSPEMSEHPWCALLVKCPIPAGIGQHGQTQTPILAPLLQTPTELAGGDAPNHL